MMNVIEVNDIHKSFKMYHDKSFTLKEKLIFRNRRKHDKHKVLKGVNLTIKNGEVIGLIGENGCGKSTLLKLMTRIMYPEKGTIKIKGKVSSLLELGAGFHPDMTGRENIYINASIFGLTKTEINNKLDEIISFSELEEFIDSPVRTYSSGMYMRLAFSVAINVDADILLVDEILAVGDASFQAKCFNKMMELKKSNMTIVIVSHDFGAIERLCDKAVWLENGNIKMQGNPYDIRGYYLDFIMNKEIKREEIRESIEKNLNEEKEKRVSNEIEEMNHTNDNDGIVFDDEKEIKRWGNKLIEITKIELLDKENKKIKKIRSESYLKIKISFEKKKNIQNFVLGIGIFRVDGLPVYGTNTLIDSIKITHENAIGDFEIEIDNLNLVSGEYYFDIAIEGEDAVPYDYYREAEKIEVYSSISDVGLVRINHRWLLDGKALMV